MMITKYSELILFWRAFFFFFSRLGIDGRIRIFTETFCFFIKNSYLSLNNFNFPLHKTWCFIKKYDFSLKQSIVFIEKTFSLKKTNFSNKYVYNENINIFSEKSIISMEYYYYYYYQWNYYFSMKMIIFHEKSSFFNENEDVFPPYV